MNRSGRGLGWLLVLGASLGLYGCQSFGAMSSPRTLKDGQVRVGVATTYHDFNVTDERITTADVQVTTQVGLSDTTELDFLLYVGGVDGRVKHSLIASDRWDLAVASGVGLFTTLQSNESSAYVPVDLVGGYRFSPDVSAYLGGKLEGELSLDSPGRGAGFDRTTLGLLGGGVVGVALESPSFSFYPQVTLMTPLATGASGTVVQISLGVGTIVK